MTPAQRERFDALVDLIIRDLPEPLREALEEVAVIVLDRPTPELLRDLDDPEAAADPDSICGLHFGYSIVDESIEFSGTLPSQIHLFRNAIVDLAGGWDTSEPAPPEGHPGHSGTIHASEAAIAEEIRITLLHELGHQMGLDEDDLFDLGYD